MAHTNELTQELVSAARRRGGAIADILGGAARKASWEVLDLVAEGRELVGGALRARADEIRRKDGPR
ncbi:hypothetical protein [Nocardia sp. NBC_00416]|uniref:hypothetical protein n=1 Tax=Nocardia sp. NBC_00416 TaxID=2975991 RepID=UPI002E21DA0D